MEVLILIQAVYRLYMLYIDRDMRLEVLIFVPGLQQVPSRSIQCNAMTNKQLLVRNVQYKQTEVLI